MKKIQSVFCVALGSVMALSLLAGCGGGSGEKPVAARICYDNLPDDNILIAVEDTQCTVKNVTGITAVDGSGSAVDVSAVATYDESTGLITAKSAGTLTLTLKDETKFRIEVVPAYVTDPQNKYSGTSADYAQTGSMLGGTHDPSLIEVEENGKPAYYIFSTGWGFGNEIRKSTDLIHWTYVGKATGSDTKMLDAEAWLESKNDGVHISWWAPDIVPNPKGGYWLYTCAVSAGPTDAEGRRKQEDGINYSKACIMLFTSDSLEPESFRYKGVLMQSCIPEGSDGAIDVNSIDPQIIYDPDGKMYMAYGSFGTGNWMLELDPETGLRKDGVYKDGRYLDWKTVRQNRNEAISVYSAFKGGQEVKTDYYGTMISQANMEAPVIARHDNVTVSDENGTIAEGKTYYYSMHSYNGLAVAYQMWGGRSESPWGRYTSVNGAPVYNERQGGSSNSGNKYMGSFTWSYKAEGVFEPNIVLPGHNDLFTTKDGTNIAAYITRTPSYHPDESLEFMVQLHQYYLNSFGDICINPNRFGKEIDRAVSADELFTYTDGGKFQMVALQNGNHAGSSAPSSVDVVLTRNGSSNEGAITYEGTQIGTWLMYGKGYIKLSFNNASGVPELATSGDNVYYGVVRPAWLNDQYKSGFTITCLGHTGVSRNMALFMNNYSTLDI